MSKWILYLIFEQSINDFTKRTSVYIHDMCLIQIVSTNFIQEGVIRIKRPPYTVTPLEKKGLTTNPLYIPRYIIPLYFEISINY